MSVVDQVSGVCHILCIYFVHKIQGVISIYCDVWTFHLPERSHLCIFWQNVTCYINVVWLVNTSCYWVWPEWGAECAAYKVLWEGGAGQAQSRRKRLDWTLFVPLSHSIPLSPSGVCRHYCINATLLPCCHQGWWPPAGPTMMLPSISHHLHPRNSSRIMITRDLIWYTECHQWKEQTRCRGLWEN